MQLFQLEQLWQILLLATIFFSLLAELKTGGTGIGALLGLFAAGGFWYFSLNDGGGGYFYAALFLGGLFCLCLEIVTPALGLWGFGGCAMMLYSIFASLGGDAAASFVIAAAAVIGTATFFALLRFLPRGRLWQKLALYTPKRPVAQGAKIDLPPVGATGLAATDFRPSGIALFGGKRFDALSEGTFIEKGAPIAVLRSQGQTLIVTHSKKQ